MLLARAHEAGVKADWGEFIDLNNGEIDKKLEYYAHCSDHIDTAPEKTESINSMRFGMCCKIIAKEKGTAYVITNRERFASDVLSLYISVEHAERVVKSKLPIDKVAI